jgi:putative inorganic carbon (HCO3(-)) transporter
MRDYFIVAVVVACLPIGLFSPYHGLLVYAWISYMYPQWLAWSFARTFPVAMLSGASLLLGFIFHRPGDLGLLRKRENVIQVALLAMFALSSAFAQYPGVAWARCEDMAKIIVVSLVASVMLTERAKLRAFLLVVALSIGFYGVKGGIFGFRSGGENIVWGPGTSMMGANNSIGLALNMCLPLLWYLARNERRWWLRQGLRLVFFLSIPAIMFTYSRASTLGLAAVLMLLVLKSRRRFTFLVLAVALGFAALPYLPERWISRQQSTIEYEEDPSAISRLEEWRFCWRVALDRPLTGAGFGLYTNDMYRQYHPEFLDMFKKRFSAHSIYFAILAEHGFIALAVFLAMMAFCFQSTWAIKRQVRGHPQLEWLKDYSDMIQVSLVGFLINGAFVEMQYFELVYHIPAVVASMRYITARALVAEQVAEPAGIAPEARPVLVS